VEATKLPKPSMERVALGNSASRQAVTRVNAEQAPKTNDVGADPTKWGRKGISPIIVL